MVPFFSARRSGTAKFTPIGCLIFDFLRRPRQFYRNRKKPPGVRLSRTAPEVPFYLFFHCQPTWRYNQAAMEGLRITAPVLRQLFIRFRSRTLHRRMLGRRTQPIQRSLFPDKIEYFLGRRLDHLRVSRGHGVYRNAASAEFFGPCLCHGDDSCFRSRVIGLAEATVVCGDDRHVDDSAMPVLDHAARYCFGAGKRAL